LCLNSALPDFSCSIMFNVTRIGKYSEIGIGTTVKMASSLQ
jgi:hypothetical protein